MRRPPEVVRALDKNIENNPMQSRMGSLAWMIYPRKHFDTSGKSPAHFQYRAIQLRSVRPTVDVRCRQGAGPVDPVAIRERRPDASLDGKEPVFRPRQAEIFT
jgi:hypothetical protein